jgi:sarcosine oxidase subunit alpha
MTAVTSSAVAHRFRLLAGYGPLEAHAAPGNKHVVGLTVAALGADRQPSGVAERIECDLVCMSTGYAPNAALIYHAGGTLAYDDDTAMFAVRSLPDHLFAAGSVNGAWDLDAVLAEGRHAGWAAARDCGLKAGGEPRVPAQRGGAGRSHPWPMFPHDRGKDFVDFDEDLQYHDIVNATLDGYDDIQLLKRYSTVGMGPSQGRHSSVASVRIAARATGRQVNEIGTTTSRPPVGPQKLSQLAGRIFEPVRRTTMHDRHLEAGAQIMIAGLWLRPAYYGAPAERDAAILREIAAVHEAVGLIDVSTLGGLEVRGPDAAELMNRMFTFGYLKQPVGRARYVLLCDENGVISDDGIACRFHDQHYYVTATTSGADTVYRTMLWFNAQWRLDVDVTNGTAAFCGVNLAGPKSREVLAGLCDDVDLSPGGFPYMGVREGHVAGIPCRLLRVGFVGELGYELHALADQGEALWDALMAAGAEHGITPFGIEAQRVLRLEKGHIIVGQDTDGLTTPHEAAMGWAVSAKKPYFVGMRAIMIQNQGGLTRQLVGFTMLGEKPPLPEENHLVIRGGQMVGRVTSAARSSAVGATIGLAYVAPDQVKPGTQFEIRVAGGRLAKAEVTTLPFYDPGNKRQEM